MLSRWRYRSPGTHVAFAGRLCCRCKSIQGLTTTPTWMPVTPDLQLLGRLDALLTSLENRGQNPDERAREISDYTLSMLITVSNDLAPFLPDDHQLLTLAGLQANAAQVDRTAPNIFDWTTALAEAQARLIYPISQPEPQTAPTPASTPPETRPGHGTGRSRTDPDHPAQRRTASPRAAWQELSPQTPRRAGFPLGSSYMRSE